MAAGAIVEDGAWLGKLHGELRGLLAPVFAQARSRLTAFAYVGALLAEPGDRRSCWQLAEEAGHATPRRMQALLAEHAWDWKAALAALQRFILAHLGDPEAIVVLDETAELKKGTKTVGVARQHAGITGQVENCQTVVFLAYVTARAHALFDFRLYLPKAWCADRERRERARVPDEVAFTTKPALGTAMITGAAGAGVPFAWVAGDEVYGRSSKLREACEKDRKGYGFVRVVCILGEADTAAGQRTRVLQFLGVLEVEARLHRVSPPNLAHVIEEAIDVIPVVIRGDVGERRIGEVLNPAETHVGNGVQHVERGIPLRDGDAELGPVIRLGSVVVYDCQLWLAATDASLKTVGEMVLVE